VVAAASCALVTGYAASLLQQSYFPLMTRTSIATAALAVGVCVFCCTKYASKIWPVVLTSVVAVIPVISANPLIFGLGDLRDSDTASYLRSEGSLAAASNGVWASDLGSFDTVMLANGVPSLSGLQRSGPNVKEWMRLDPDGSHANEWNRGGGFIKFVWTVGQPLSFETPGPDTTIVRADPCDLKVRWPNLQTIASTQSQDAACLLPERTLSWSGKEIFLYKFN